MKNNITTIAFDFGGVLVTRIDNSYLQHMASAVGAPEEQFIEALWKYRSRYDKGDLDAAAYWQMVLEDSLEDSGAEKSARPGSFKETFELLMHLDSYGWSWVNPGMIRWISTLRREGYRRCIISNMAVETFETGIRDSLLPAYFEKVILSGGLGINKPDREVFLEAARQMELDPGEILFLDDLACNVEGARKAGCHALQFTDTESLALALEEAYPGIPREGLVLR